MAVYSGKRALDGKISRFLTYPPVMDGLQVGYSAFSPSSYPGSGSTIYDISGNNRDGTIVGSPSYVGNIGGSTFKCFDFDNNSSKYIDTNTSATTLGIQLLDYTMQGWFYSNGSTADQCMFGGGSAAPFQGLHLNFRTTNIQQGHFSADVSYGGAAVFGSWVNVAFTFDNGASPSSRCYVNGSQIGTGSQAAWNSSGNLLLHYPNWTSTYPWNGYATQWLCYNRVLSASEILENYNQLKSDFGL